MKFHLLEPARLIVAVAAFVALALGVGNPASAKAPVTEEQAEAADVAGNAADVVEGIRDDRPDAQATDIFDDAVNGSAGNLVPQTAGGFDWSAAAEPPAWFPTLDQDALTLTPSPVQRVDLSAAGVAASE